MRSKHFLFGSALLILSFASSAGYSNPGASEHGGGGAVQLEVRQYRFSKHSGGYDRLVLEFERKDSGNHKAPQVTTHAAESGEWNIELGNTVLLGAIPESLINESYASKSRFLGPMSLNLDSSHSGFSIRVATKAGTSRVQASWLANPARLVIDAYGQKAVHAHRQALSVHHESPKHPGLDSLMCFPATSKVALTVIFQGSHQQSEELQNIRVNTDGTTLAPSSVPPSDAIVCYPRKSQILASLSFEDKPRNEIFTQQPVSERIFTPPPAPAPKAVAEKALANELDLDPVGAGLGQLPTSFGTPRAPAQSGTAAPAAHASPLSLLPPLNK
jgi:hypothetical protein